LINCIFGALHTSLGKSRVCRGTADTERIWAGRKNSGFFLTMLRTDQKKN
jgi:hypothetical protein